MSLLETDLDRLARFPASGAIGGLDGCRVGWILVTASTDESQPTEVNVISDLMPLMPLIDDGSLVALGIDIPIGLPESDPRRCDVQARQLIGPRRNSVFPAPLRPLLHLEDYPEANETSRRISGKGLSKQAFAILPKIKEVDGLMTAERQTTFFEIHPEVSFTVLAGSPMTMHKRDSAGRTERLAALRKVFPEVDQHVSRRIPGTQPDDVLDAYVAAWSARRHALGESMRLGGEVDGRGLRMEMIA